MKSYHKLMFFTVFLFNIVLRYPIIYVEKGSDSYSNHLLAQAVIDNGSDHRFLNVLSFFGLYPGSNNMGGIFVLSSQSLVTDLSILNSIFILSFAITIIGGLNMFLFMREITRNNTICIISIMFFTTSRLFLSFTELTYSLRPLYLALLPLLFYFIMRFIKTLNNNVEWKRLLPIMFFLPFLFAVHRASLMTGLLFFSIIILLIFKYLQTNLISRLKESIKMPIFTLGLSLLYVSSIFGYYFYSGASETSLESGRRFFDSDALAYTIINLGLMYSMQFGILLPFALIGYVSLFQKKAITFAYLLIVMISFSLIWTDLIYGSLTYLPIIVVLVCLGIESFSTKLIEHDFSKAKVYAIILPIVLVSQSVPEFVVVQESEYDYTTAESNYSRELEYILAEDAGLYISSNNEDDLTIISYLAAGKRISAHSGSPYYIESELSDNYQDYPFTLEDIYVFLSGEVNYLFELSDENLERTYRYDVLLSRKEWDDESTRVNLNYIFKENNIFIFASFSGNQFLVKDDYGNFIESIFLVSLIDDNYKFYDNGFHNLYRLNMD